MSYGREASGSAGNGLESSASVPAASMAAGEALAPEAPAGTLDSGDPAVHCALRRPDGYEPHYAYPLIVWFHDAGGDEQELLSVLPLISGRNYAGLSLRGPLPVRRGLPSRRRWSLADGYLDLLEDELAISFQHAAAQLNIHWERVVAVGTGQGATVALRLLLRRPEWFAGAACLGATWTSETRLEAWGQYANKPLWLGHVRGWTPADPRSAISHGRLLLAAGFDVTVHVAEWDDADPQTLGLEIDRWLMRSLCGETAVI